MKEYITCKIYLKKKNAFINLRLQVLTRLSLSTVAAALCPNYCKRVGGACATNNVVTGLYIYGHTTPHYLVILQLQLKSHIL